MLAPGLRRSWSAALEQLRRDATTVARRIAGHGASPVVARHPRPHASDRDRPEAAKARVDASARELVVARVIQETRDAVTLVLRDEADAPFHFLPGQFFTILTEQAPASAAGGDDYRSSRSDQESGTVPRNYSASNAPDSSELHLTIKRKPGGLVSGSLQEVAAGARLRVLGPFGSFTVTPREGAARRLVLVAGGAGITPLASIARSVLAREPSSQVALVYGNRSEADVILASELDALARAYEGRFSILHVLEQVDATSALEGRLDRVTAGRAFDAIPFAQDKDVVFFVCGPDAMRDEVVATLSTRGVTADRVKVERFTIGPRPQPTRAPAKSAAHARLVEIRVGKITHRANVLPGATLLEAGLAAGAPMPFSCAAGGCGACRVRLVEGEVDVEEPSCLSEAERAAGYVLTCVGRPTGPCTIDVPDPAAGSAEGGPSSRSDLDGGTA